MSIEDKGPQYQTQDHPVRATCPLFWHSTCHRNAFATMMPKTVHVDGSRRVLAMAFAFAFLLPAVNLAKEYGQTFAALWGKLSLQEKYGLLFSFPKGGDIHNHHSGTGHAEAWLEFGRNETLTRGELFYTRHEVNGLSGEDAILWETIPGCSRDQLPPEEQQQFRLLRDLSPADQRHWVSEVRVLSSKDPRNHFYSRSFQVLGGLTDNLYVKTEILVYWMKQLGSEHATYLETMTNLKFQENCSPVNESWAQEYIEERLKQSDVNESQVVVYFQQYVPRTHPEAQKRLQNVISSLDSGDFPRWVGANIVGPEQDDRGCLDHLLVNQSLVAELSHCKSCRWSVHAGELRCCNKNVLEAIHDLNASRIGHGLNWFDDGPIMNETLDSLRARDILIETNLISNKALGILAHFEDHPFPHLLHNSIPTCLCTDNSAMWGSTLTDEYMLAAELLPKESLFDAFDRMGFNSLRYAFAPEDVKQELMKNYRGRMRSFAASCLEGNPQRDCFTTPNKMSTFACLTWPDLCPTDEKVKHITATYPGHGPYLQEPTTGATFHMPYLAGQVCPAVLATDQEVELLIQACQGVQEATAIIYTRLLHEKFARRRASLHRLAGKALMEECHRRQERRSIVHTPYQRQPKNARRTSDSAVKRARAVRSLTGKMALGNVVGIPDEELELLIEAYRMMSDTGDLEVELLMEAHRQMLERRDEIERERLTWDVLAWVQT